MSCSRAIDRMSRYFVHMQCLCRSISSLTLFSSFALLLTLNYAVNRSSLEVSNSGGTVIDGALQLCPGTIPSASLTGSHDSTGNLIRWEIGAPIVCSTVATHSTNPSDALCGTFIISALNQPTALRMSTLVLPVDQSLNGAVVTCNAGALTSDPLAGNLTIQVIGEIVKVLCHKNYHVTISPKKKRTAEKQLLARTILNDSNKGASKKF